MGKKVNCNNENDEKAKLYATVEQLTVACESYRCELQKQEDKNAKDVLKLNREIETLQLEMCRLQEKLDHWKTTCHRQQNENVLIAKSKLLVKDNNALKQDMDVFKTVIRRLNKEMAFYQQKLRKIYQSTPNQIPLFSLDSKVSSLEEDESNEGGGDALQRDDLQNPTNTLLPLLTAYDEVIEDKNETIRDHELLLEKFKLKLQQIAQENEQLHSVIAECKGKGSVSIEEWKSLYDNAILVLEENDLLHEKVEVVNRKLAVIETSHAEKVEKLKKKITALDEEKSKLKTGLTEMDTHCSRLTEQITNMSLSIQNRIPKEEHECTISEYHEQFNALKAKYASERTILIEKLKEAGIEKEKLAAQFNSTNAEISKLEYTVKSLEKSNLEYAGSLVVLRKELSITVNAIQINEANSKEMVKLAEVIAQEKEALEKSYNHQRQSTAKIMAVRSQELTLIKEFEEKLKTIEADYEKKLEHHISRAKKLEDVLETLAERHQADLSHLHDLVKEKNVHIEKLNTEKRQLMEDLETVWRATTRDQSLSRTNQTSQGPRKASSSDKRQDE